MNRFRTIHHPRSLLLILACAGSAFAAPIEDRHQDVVNTFAAVDCALELRLDADALRDAGLLMSAETSAAPDRQQLLFFDLQAGQASYRVLRANQHTPAILGGEFTMRGPQFAIQSRAGHTVEFDALRIVHDTTGRSDYEFAIFLTDRSALHVFDLSGANVEFDWDAGVMIVEADLRIATQMAVSLGLSAIDTAVLGRAAITVRMELTETVLVDDTGAPVSGTLHAMTPTPGDAASVTQGPDVIVGDLHLCQQFGRIGAIGSGTVGLSIGTTSCNKGDQPLNWLQLPNTDHPVIPYYLYRLKTVDGADRFEQIGHSWMKHAFFALELNACGFGCSTTNSNGRLLGPGCSDPYTTSLNSVQCSLGPPAAVNPYTGVFAGGDNVGSGGGCSGNYPSRNHVNHSHDGVSHRLRVLDTDLMPDLNPGANYFTEAQYVTHHEYQAANGNQNNNVSHRQVDVSGPNAAGIFTFWNNHPMIREQPAIDAWIGATQSLIEPAPLEDGRAYLATKVTDLGNGQWHYEYALYNMNLDRSIASFSIPLPSSVTTTNLGFHAPLNHPPTANTPTFSSDPWTAVVTSDAITWSIDPFDDENANAIRFGTLYNFRFDANAEPAPATSTIGLFKTNDFTQADSRGPCDAAKGNCSSTCTDDADCAPGTLCDTASGFCRAVDCITDEHCPSGQVCDPDDNFCKDCLIDEDCDPGLICSTLGTCAQCTNDSHCDDGLSCTDDICTFGVCEFVETVCAPPLVCDPRDGQCKECITADDCSAGQVCDPIDRACIPPCLSNLDCPPAGSINNEGLLCDLADGACKQCLDQGHCDDGLFCNGDELCTDGLCQPSAAPCSLQECDEDKNVCMLNGDPLRGGLLYDNWMATLGAPGPTEDHPLWKFRPDQTSNTRTGSATWRCKECHAWDRKGDEGQYATGSHKTGFPGIVGTTLSPIELVALLTEPPADPQGGGVTNGHGYGDVLSTTDIEDLTAWVQDDGSIDDDDYIDPLTGTFTGDPLEGEVNYQFGGSISCGVCHGTDGTAINFGSSNDPVWVGTHALENPWELMHKVRYGNPGTPMPSWIAAGGDLQGIADLGRYVQDVLPIDCLNESHCTGDTACLTDTCLDGRCTFSQRAYGDLAGAGGSCGPDETVGLSDILMVLDGFSGIFAAGCGFDDINIAGDNGSCTPNDSIDLADILAVLNAFQGDDPCCTAAESQRRAPFNRPRRDPD